MSLNFIDINVWLYRLFDDKRIEPNEREKKRNIAIKVTQKSNLVISTQVINELSVNLLKKAQFQEEEIKQVILTSCIRTKILNY